MVFPSDRLDRFPKWADPFSYDSGLSAAELDEAAVRFRVVYELPELTGAQAKRVLAERSRAEAILLLTETDEAKMLKGMIGINYDAYCHIKTITMNGIRRQKSASPWLKASIREILVYCYLDGKLHA